MIKYQGIWFYLVLFFISGFSSASSDLNIEIMSSWNGVFKSNQASEVKVRLVSKQSGLVKVQLGQLFQQINLTANIPTQLSLIYKPQINASAVINFSSTTLANTEREKTIALTRSDKVNVATLGEGFSVSEQQSIQKPLLALNTVNAFFVSTASLPDFNLGYQAIDMLVLHFSALKNMNEQQSDAFSQYISQCGKVVAVQFPLAIYNKLENIAGCDGRFLSTVSSPLQLTNKVSGLLKINPVSLPTLTDLKEFVAESEQGSPYKMLVIFCFSYLLLVIIFSLFKASQLILFSLPLLAILTTFIVWFSQDPQYNLTSWLEMGTEDSRARYIAHLQLRGRGGWTNEMLLPIEAGFSTVPSDLEFQLPITAKSQLRILFDLSLFSEYQWFWQSSTQLDVPLTIDIQQQQAIVRNISSKSTEAGYFSWLGQTYKLPELQAGQQWQASKAVDITKSTWPINMLQQQVGGYIAAVIIPYSASIVSFETEHKGWLFIHAKQGMAR